VAYVPYVPPDGPSPCRYAIVGEAPAREELRQGRGFCGPSGALLWPLMLRLAFLNRAECYVTNLSKVPVSADDGELKFTDAEFVLCQTTLLRELLTVRPERVLAVGAWAAKALLGDRYTTMEACNGIGFQVKLAAGVEFTVIPTWHPAAALRPGGEDKLSFTAAAVEMLRASPITLHPWGVKVPEPEVWSDARNTCCWTDVAIDTEGVPEDAICATAAGVSGPGEIPHRVYIEAADVPAFFAGLRSDAQLKFFNAPWDWRVLWAMGAPLDIATRWEWCDVSELAYLAQTEPQNLKDLTYRHLGIRMPSFLDTVLPHYDELVRAIAEGRISTRTALITHSPKTGKLLKRPKVIMAPEVKPLHRALDNPKLLAERLQGVLPWVRPSKHSGLSSVLRIVPARERIEYATLDAWATLMLEPRVRRLVR
jgi:uracil-DNA glycosylase family 4